MKENQITQVIQALESLYDAVEDNSIGNLKGDGTGWTIADSLENLLSISDSLESIANTLKKIEAKMK
jgi:hypothetical protein